MPESIKTRTLYFDEAFASDLTPMIESFKERTKYLKFDTIVGTGLSGALVVPTIARALGLKWAIVRKHDGSHSSNQVEGEIGQRWLFVDDFIASGATLRRVKDAIAYRQDEYNNTIRYRHARYEETDDIPESLLFHTEYVGTYQYARNGSVVHY